MASPQDPPLYRIIRQKTPSDVAAALATGADPDAPSADGKYTPLGFVAELSMSETYRRDIVGHLLAARADVSKASPSGDRPLHAAVRKGDTHLAALFLLRGADIHAVDCHGNTALHVAARIAAGSGKSDMMRFLLKNGANSLLQNTAGQTPRAYADAARATSLFPDVPRGHFDVWERNKPALRQHFERIHARDGLSSALAVSDQDRIAALIEKSPDLRLAARSKGQAHKHPPQGHP